MEDTDGCFAHFVNPLRSRPVNVDECALNAVMEERGLCANNLYSRHETGHLFLAQPLFGPLLFQNNDSEARDHCANERTFLSWLKLSIYMSIVSVAILVSFHLKTPPTAVERRMAIPLGVIFWLAALACLANGFANYIKTVSKYSRRQALVQRGWKTEVVSFSISGP